MHTRGREKLGLSLMASVKLASVGLALCLFSYYVFGKRSKPSDTLAEAFTLEPNIAKVSDDAVRVTFSRGGSGGLLTWSEALRALVEAKTFRKTLSKVLAGMPFSSFYLECSPVSSKTQYRTFEFVVSNAPHLASNTPGIDAFSTYLSSMRGTTRVKAFPNLGGSSWLISPAQFSHDTSHYGQLASFVRGAPTEQQDALWRELGRVAGDAFKEIAYNLEEPIWISTEGSGVPWLHLRIDPRPKYYHWQPYKNPAYGLVKSNSGTGEGS